MRPIAENLWTLTFPLSLLGQDHGRVVTIIRLRTSELIIHSTAPFSESEISAIPRLGRPGWLVEAILLHDTFAHEGRAAFPDIPYLAPEGFAESAQVDSIPLLPAPPEWGDEVKVLLIEGMPSVKEHVFLHVPSRTLIVADFVFDFGNDSGWSHFVRRYLMGLKKHPDVTRVYPRLIRDRGAFDRSVQELLTWDFDRIIVGHKEVVPTNGKARLQEALRGKSLLAN